MSIRRPTIYTPKKILEYLNTEKNPVEIFRFLSELRRDGYALNLDVNKPADMICYALTTDNIKSIDAKKLRAAIDPTQIIALILEVLILILKLIEASGKCKKNKTNAKNEFINKLKELKDNPFTNLAKMHLSDANLSGVDLKWANLQGAKLINVNLTNANLQNANLRDAVLENNTCNCCDLSRADLRWADLCQAYKVTVPRQVNLKSFLQTNYPNTVRVDLSFTNVEQLKGILSTIQDELEDEKLKEHSSIKSAQKSIKRDHYYKMMATNIVKVTDEIKDNPALARDMIKAAIKHALFDDHFNSYVGRVFNKVVTLFHHSKHAIPDVGSPAQNILIDAYKKYDDQLKHGAGQPLQQVQIQQSQMQQEQQPASCRFS